MTGRPTLRVQVHQTSPVLADVVANLSRLQTAAATTTADVLVFPELALTGYTLGHRARELGLDLSGEGPARLPEGGPVAVYGLVERGEDHLPAVPSWWTPGAGCWHGHPRERSPSWRWSSSETWWPGCDSRTPTSGTRIPP